MRAGRGLYERERARHLGRGGLHARTRLPHEQPGHWLLAGRGGRERAVHALPGPGRRHAKVHARGACVRGASGARRASACARKTARKCHDARERGGALLVDACFLSAPPQVYINTSLYTKVSLSATQHATRRQGVPASIAARGRAPPAKRACAACRPAGRGRRARAHHHVHVVQRGADGAAGLCTGATCLCWLPTSRPRTCAHRHPPRSRCQASQGSKTRVCCGRAVAVPQVPDATVWYGPDTYMGRNLAQLFSMLADLPDEEVRT